MKFNLKIYIGKKCLEASEISFPNNTTTVSEVRTWLNESDRFVNIGETIFNTSRVDYFEVEPVESIQTTDCSGDK